MKRKKIIILIFLTLIAIFILQLIENTSILKINDKKIIMQKKDTDENFNVVDNKEYQESLELSYDIIEKDEEKLKLLVYIQDEKNGLARIEFPNNNILIVNGTTKKIAKDYDVEMGKEYKIKIALQNGEEKEKIINIKNVGIEKKYIIQNGKDNTDVTGGWQGIQYYGRETGDLTFEDGYANFVGTDAATIYRKVTANSINWYLYKTLNMKVKPYNPLVGFSRYGSISIEITDSKDSFTQYYTNSLITYGLVESPTIDQETIVSATLPTQYIENTYISIGTHRCYLYVYDIWLEKYVEIKD